MARQKQDLMEARWRTMNRRCHAPNCTHYARYGAVGVRVVEEWNISNSTGFKNFEAWVRAEINKIPEEHRLPFYKVMRFDLKGDFGPANCYVTSKVAHERRRPTSEWNYPKERQNRRSTDALPLAA